MATWTGSDVPDAATLLTALRGPIESRRAGLGPGEELAVVLAADRTASYSLVVAVLDALRQLGVTHYSLMVAPAEPEPSAEP